MVQKWATDEGFAREKEDNEINVAIGTIGLPGWLRLTSYKTISLLEDIVH